MLNELAYFQQEIDLPRVTTYDDLQDLRCPLMCKIDLYFTENKEQGKLQKVKYAQVCSKTYRMGDLVNGVYKFVPVEFTGNFTSVLNMSVHATMTDLKPYSKSRMRLVSS